MTQTGDGSAVPPGSPDELVHDQQEDHEVRHRPRVWLHRFRVWRDSVRSRSSTNRLYRLAVGMIGGAIVVSGLLLVPLPGPGWLIVFVGLAVLATEFTWADRLEKFARKKVEGWTRWLMKQPVYIRAFVGLGTFLLVLGFFWLLFLVTGLPSWVPARLVPSWTGLG